MNDLVFMQLVTDTFNYTSNLMNQILLIILSILITIVAQAFVASLLNLIFSTRFPRSFSDFLKLTFLPYVLYWLIADPNHLKNNGHI